MIRIHSKYTPFLLLPANTIPSVMISECETDDGVKCLIEFQATWNNKEGEYDEELDSICEKYYECPFSSIRSIWFGRLGRVDDYWHLIKLKKK